MKKRRQLSIGAAALAAIGIGLLIAGRSWQQQSRGFNTPYRVQSGGDTNYVVRLMETTVGKSDRGAALIVYVGLENPNAFDVVLDRRNFVLMDREKNFYVPSTTGTQTVAIKLPAHGVAEREMLSYVVPDNAFAGVLALQIGHLYWVQLKGEKPYQAPLRVGEFHTFRRRDW